MGRTPDINNCLHKKVITAMLGFLILAFSLWLAADALGGQGPCVVIQRADGKLTRLCVPNPITVKDPHQVIAVILLPGTKVAICKERSNQNCITITKTTHRPNIPKTHIYWFVSKTN